MEQTSHYRCAYLSVWEVGELVFPDVPPAEDAHHVLPLQLGHLVANDGGERGAARRLHHESGPVEGGHGRLDLVVAHEDDRLHVAPTQLEGQCAWDAKKRRGTERKVVKIVTNSRNLKQ